MSCQVSDVSERGMKSAAAGYTELTPRRAVCNWASEACKIMLAIGGFQCRKIRPETFLVPYQTEKYYE